MLSPETLESYRRMTPGQRLELMFELSRFAMSGMFAGPPEVVARRFELIQRENDARTQAICEALVRSKDKPHPGCDKNRRPGTEDQ